MTELNKLKNCPSCHTPKPPEEQVKTLSRSSGRKTSSWRCVKCINRRKVGNKVT